MVNQEITKAIINTLNNNKYELFFLNKKFGTVFPNCTCKTTI